MKNKFRILTLLSVFLTTFYFQPVSAQENEKTVIDSLNLIVNGAAYSDIQKVNSSLELSKIYLKKNIDSAIVFAEKGKVLAEKINYNKGIALGLIRLGEIKEIENNIEEAKTLVAEAISLYENLDKDKDYLSACNLLGFFYESQTNYDKALEIYMLGLKSAKIQGDQLLKGFFLNNISNIYDNIDEDEESLKFVLEASSIFEELGSDKYYGYTLVNIGILYIELEEYDLALKYFRKAEKVHVALNNNYGLMQIDHNIGEIFEIEAKYVEALDYYLKALDHAFLLEEIDPERNYRIAHIRKNIGNIYFLIKDYRSAIPEFKSAIELGEKINSHSILQKSYKGLYSSYLKLNNSDSASHYINLFLPVNDSLVAERYNQRIDELNFDYKLDIEKNRFNNEKEVLVLEKKRRSYLYAALISGLGVVILIVGFLWYFQKEKYLKSKLKGENLRLEKENLAFALERKSKELTSTVLHLIERNEFISNIAHKLENIDSKEETIDLKKINDIIKELDRNINKKLWKEFEMSYIEIHNEDFQKLSKRCPKLTSNDRRLCALISLNMSTKDISSITYQSAQSIKIARYRLRKKLGLAKNENLTSFLHSL